MWSGLQSHRDAGITTAQMHGGVMQVSHTGVEKCGRRGLAEYAFTFIMWAT